MPAVHFAPGIALLAERAFSLVFVNKFHKDGNTEFKMPVFSITHLFCPCLQNFVRHHWVHRRRQEGKCKQCGKVRFPAQHSTTQDA